jgi:hypothetical protein
MNGDILVPAVPVAGVGASLALLIEQLEKVSEGFSLLDKAIATACNVPWSPDEDGNFGGYGILPRRCHFTRSLDAALTLVPEGYSGNVFFGVGPLQIANVNCHVAGPGVDISEDHVGIAATPALALCVAALRARATMKPHEAPTPAQSTAGAKQETEQQA